MTRIIFILLMTVPNFMNAQSHNKIDAVILGTFHFGETPDFKSSEYDDILKPKRQRELKALVKKLADYRPDKIFVENTPEAQDFWDKVYTDYQRKVFPSSLSILQNEIFQIGIRTASLLKNEHGVICINYINPDALGQWPSDMVERKWKEYANQVNLKKPEFEEFFKSNTLASATFHGFLEEHDSWKKLSLNEHLIKMNEEESLRALQYFNVLAWMDNDVNGVGAELTSMEYHRNLKILQNLYSKLERTDKKILIIFGAAHAQILTDLLKSHPVFNIVKVKEILN